MVAVIRLVVVMLNKQRGLTLYEDLTEMTSPFRNKYGSSLADDRTLAMGLL